jgi:hypothetical protein
MSFEQWWEEHGSTIAKGNHKRELALCAWKQAYSNGKEYIQQDLLDEIDALNDALDHRRRWTSRVDESPDSW